MGNAYPVLIGFDTCTAVLQEIFNHPRHRMIIQRWVVRNYRSIEMLNTILHALMTSLRNANLSCKRY